MSLTFTQQKKPTSSLIPAHQGHKDHQAAFQPPVAAEAPLQPGFGHEFGKVDVLPREHGGPQFSQSCPLALPSPRACPFGGACHTCPAPMQAKLTISQPGDRYEQEADRVADRVMSMPEPRNGQRLQRECSECENEVKRQEGEPEDKEKEEEEPEETASASLLQRQEAGEEKEEEEPEGTASPKLLQRQEVGEEEEEEEGKTVSPKAQPGRTPQATPAVTANIHALRSGGQPLSPSTRAFFEPRFGHDFGRVRVHNDTRAAETAQAVNARAFTLGRDVVFGAGQYTPDTHSGRRLMAHELAHVAQQKTGLQHISPMNLPLVNDKKKTDYVAREVIMAEESKKSGKGEKGAKTEKPKDKRTLSGKKWRKIADEKWNKSSKIDDLSSTFKPKFEKFKKVLNDNGITESIDTTKRPYERAYLMHYAWKIAKDKIKPENVPAQKGVDINWDHGDKEKSKKAAQSMVSAFGMIAMASLTSNHLKGNAVDMALDFSKFNKDRKLTYKVKDKDTVRIIKIDDEAKVGVSAKGKKIASIGDRELSKAGADFGVKRALDTDIVHWSTTGK